ncbi:uncharacterized protein DFL_005344 [Arthrobotrys flagrans]|uniref:C2H2-type domain-containing protein n=1 Tax=Arthrobotrys flagrans TaxID=97331 RepID=A0A437A7D1_ARTFL|nr:hypothetical protein DFL_005344 [Arthrobotrys flagrans]
MDPSMHLSHPNQQSWDPGAPWCPNQVPASEFEPYGIPHEQHGHHSPVHSEGIQPRSHRSRKRSKQNPEFGERDFKVNSYRPVFSVPPENVSRTSKGGCYEFAESCHEFPVSDRVPQEVDGRQNARKKGAGRQVMHYAQEAEFDDNYFYEAQGSNEFDHISNQEAAPIFYCTHPRCGYACPDKNSLRKHVSIHGEKKFSCENCTADFHTARDLRRHQEAKHTVSNARKYYICKVSKCPRDETKPLSRKDNARQHVMQVHGIGNGRVDDFIEEIVRTTPEIAEPQFRAGHRPTGSSSTDDTVYSTLSYDSNPGYHSHEDPEGEDIIAEFTYLQEYDSDLDVGHPFIQENWQQQIFGPWAVNHENQTKCVDPSSRLQGRRRSRSDAQTRSPSHLDPQVPQYYQERGDMVQNEDLQQYHITERSHCYSDRSSLNQPLQSQIKEESPGPGQHHRLPSTASTATKKPAKRLPNPVGKTYHSETSATTDSLEAAFEKALVI